VQSQKKFPRTFSFEFFRLIRRKDRRSCARRPAATQLKPKFFSVTFGAGGSTRERTLGTVLDIRAMGHAAAPHISCIASTRDNLREWLQRYKDKGIRHIVALRGDLPSGLAATGEFRFASELVEFIRSEFNDTFLIEVAAYPEFHPQAKSARDDLLAFKRKVDAGAASAITQYFYTADAYRLLTVRSDGHQYSDRARHHVDRPFFGSSRAFRRLRCRNPALDSQKLEGYGDDNASIRAFGLDVVTALCDDLLRHGAPGLHFYTLNQAGLTTTIWQRLGL
jgi:methylenetetrahydrofolate reductase (NADPH)